MKLLEEFKAFAIRGNVIDLAVGVVIGTAFGRIVSSLVGDVIMPVLGFITGGIDFSNLKWVLKPELVRPDGTVVEAVIVSYGQFIQTIISFFMIAWAVFAMVKVVNRLYRPTPKPTPPEAPPAPSPEVQILTEIRDVLKSRA